MERTPSFYFYPETNSFYCFGCKQAGGPVRLVSLMEEIAPYSASLLLLENFDSIESTGAENYSIDAKLLFEFSALIRSDRKSVV